MLKAAMEKLLELKKPETVVVGHDTFLTDGKGGYKILPKNRLTSPLEINTLTAILDYIISGTDKEKIGSERRFVIHIKDPENVCLGLELNSDKNREWLLMANTKPTAFPFGRWLDMENFIISIQQFFVDSDNARALIKIVSSVTDSKSVQQEDNGVGQTVTAKQGIALEKKITLPNPIVLAPYRTFMEVEQPESPFVFRMRGGETGVTAALFTADGNAWKSEAIIRIKAYFEENLPSEFIDRVIIIA